MGEYPEHEKLKAIQEQSQAVGEFMDWLADDGIFLAHHIEDHNFPHPYHRPIQELLAEFFQIDRDKIEAEKQQMLAEIRQLNENEERRKAAWKVYFAKHPEVQASYAHQNGDWPPEED